MHANDQGESRMTGWSEQPSVVAAMLNPALIAALLASTAEGHAKETSQGVPVVLSFVAAPLALHRGTREALPASTATHLATWVSRNPVLRAGLPQRAVSLVEPVRAGIRFGLAHDVLSLDRDRLSAVPRKRPRGVRPPPQLNEVLRKANLVGRWLAKTDSPATVLALLGVAP
ncbi:MULTISPECIES: three component ABC system middle component [unclassified Streptomyces]|uniref:three component ABC system middle component n=1 Tax=Streptomyces sp. DI166 TaxID=1839783 RepID=UPI00210040F2|nr:three component ABC system middle component [Streptomyces sp. DI166]